MWLVGKKESCISLFTDSLQASGVDLYHGGGVGELKQFHIFLLQYKTTVYNRLLLTGYSLPVILNRVRNCIFTMIRKESFRAL